MINVYKFEDYECYDVHSEVLDCYVGEGNQCPCSFRYMHKGRNNSLIMPVPKHIPVTADKDVSYLGVIHFDEFVETKKDITYNDKVYIHSGCTIPRAKVSQKYTRVLKPEKADICVIPQLPYSISTYITAIFVNKDKYKVYVLRSTRDWKQGKYVYNTPDKCKGFTLGSTVLDINPSLRNTTIEETSYYGDGKRNTFSMENWRDFLNSTLIYYGSAASASTKEAWIADLMYNKMHNLVTEDKILATLGDSTNEFTEETYINLKEMLESTDNTVVGLGLKAVAEMDYDKYRNTAIHLLCNCNSDWSHHDMRNNSSVKYMLEHLQLWGYPRERYAKTTTQEEFDLLKETIRSDFNERVNAIQSAFNSRFPFADLHFEYTFTVAPKLKDTEETETN